MEEKLLNSCTSTMKRLTVYVSLVVLVLLTACTDGDTFMHQYRAVDRKGWLNSDTIVFSLTPSLTKQILQAEVDVRTTDAFEYTTLYLLGILKCDDSILSSDTIAINIFDKEGLSTGKGFPFPICSADIPPIEVDSGLTYSYTLSPLMKDGGVRGIKDVGIKLKRMEDEGED